MGESLLEKAKDDVRKYLVEVEECKESAVEEFLEVSFGEDELAELMEDGEMDYPSLLTRYKEFRAYSLDEIRRALEYKLEIDENSLIDFMGGYEEQESFHGFRGFFPGAEKDGVTLDLLIAEAIIAMAEKYIASAEEN